MISEKSQEESHVNHLLSDVSFLVSGLYMQQKCYPSKPICADSVRFEIQNYIVKNPESDFNFKVHSIKGNTADSSLHLKELSYQSKLEEEDFLHENAHRVTYVSLLIPRMHLQKIQYEQLLNENQLITRAITMEDVTIHTSIDRRKKKHPDFVPIMPNKLLQKVPFYLKVDFVGVQNMTVTYAEQVENNMRNRGKISFNETDILIRNVTNDPKLMTKATPAELRGSTKFMNEGRLNVNMRIPLLEESHMVDYKGSLGTMDASELNQMIKPNAKVDFKKGEIKTIDFSGTVRGKKSEGELLANYRSFKVRVFKSEEKKRSLMSFLSNLLIQRNNKKKKGEIYYQAAPQDGFFKILWSCLKNGLIDTLLPGMLLPDEDTKKSSSVQ
jgi:hypothetical protein